ncbi:MAG: 16S rRNA (cytosine(967)-C(5))-methyltransferase [Epulopiscium sp. Nuni2H_MBin001]|nr:MAG: 16S rRNA (cytosine(967)-C(5))-methyltransferase [Epulopiscium sp. Nuni2H_MBin001]
MKCAREVSVDILTKIEKEGGYVQLVLKDELEGKQDKSFITEVVYGSIKHKLTLDYIISSNTKTNKIKPFVRNLLRVSVYQLMYLDRVPPSAVINEAVKIIKRRNMGSLSGFVNGVLRQIDRTKHEISYPSISIKYSMPEWIVNLWIEMYGEDKTIKICESLNNRAKICARVNSKNAIQQLINENIKYTAGHIFPNECVYIEGANSIANIKSFVEGLWTVQDESAMLVGYVLNPHEGDTILDICAAPGGKTSHMAYLANNKASIMATDIYEHKIELINKTVTRLGATEITTKRLDACVFDSSLENKFDKVLADVPCSGLGILKRKPDIRYNKSLDDIAQINIVQKNIVANAVKYVKPGGVFVYSTCTLSETENKDMVKWMIEELGLVADTIEVPEVLKSCVDGCSVEILPYIADTDGFFIAKFRK